VQMPDNWQAPTHRIPADILDEGDWPQAARMALMQDRLSDVRLYAGWLQPAHVDVWRTTYYQDLTGAEAVWTWATGSVLRPVAFCDGWRDRARFEALCRSRYLEAYPPGIDGVTTLPFSRLFIVALAT
jgi:trans-aconitate 2-methyltransferase